MIFLFVVKDGDDLMGILRRSEVKNEIKQSTRIWNNVLLKGV